MIGKRQNVLLWGFVDSRQYLSCLHGYGLCLWRLGRFRKTAEVMNGILRLSPRTSKREKRVKRTGAIGEIAIFRFPGRCG
jgi:hypothetical protein